MMKYLYTLTLVTTIILMSSCRKERDCKCTSIATNTSDGTTISSTSTTSTDKMTKKDAKTYCESNNANYTSGGYNYEFSCELD